MSKFSRGDKIRLTEKKNPLNTFIAKVVISAPIGAVVQRVEGLYSIEETYFYEKWDAHKIDDFELEVYYE